MKRIFEEPLYLQDFSLAEIYRYERGLYEASGDEHFELLAAKEKGLLLYKEKFIGDIKFEKNDSDNLQLMCEVKAELYKNVKYKAEISLSPDNEILDTSCTCKIGQSPASCKHIFAALHAIVDYSQKEMFLACTEKLQQWHRPKIVKTMPKPLHEVFGKKTWKFPPQKINYSALIGGTFNSQFWSVKLQSNEILSQFTIPLPACVVSRNPEFPFSINNEDKHSLDFVYSKLKFNIAEIWELERNTYDQNNCEEWKRERKYRLTSSNFHDIYRHASKEDALVDKMLKDSNINHIPSVMYGIQNESYVRNLIRSKFPCHIIRKTGIITNPFMPHLAASPDGLIFNENEAMLLEIKCIYNNENKDIEVLSQNPNFCLEYTENGWTLKKNHKYYFQVQGQLALSNLNECLFVVFYKKPSSIILCKVLFDKVFWENVYLKLSEFYCKYYLPKLIEATV